MRSIPTVGQRSPGSDHGRNNSVRESTKRDANSSAAAGTIEFSEYRYGMVSSGGRESPAVVNSAARFLEVMPCGASLYLNLLMGGELNGASQKKIGPA